MIILLRLTMHVCRGSCVTCKLKPICNTDPKQVRAVAEMGTVNLRGTDQMAKLC